MQISLIVLHGIELFSSIFRQMENWPRRNEVTISVSTQLTYPLLITVHPVQHLYIGSEVVIIFDDVRIPYIVKAEPVAESGSGIVAKAISQASDSRRRLRCWFSFSNFSENTQQAKFLHSTRGYPARYSLGVIPVWVLKNLWNDGIDWKLRR